MTNIGVGSSHSTLMKTNPERSASEHLFYSYTVLFNMDYLGKHFIVRCFAIQH